MKKAIVILGLLVACGGNGGGWSDSERADFIAGCESAGTELTDEQKAQLSDLCECSADKAEADDAEPDDFTPELAAQYARECQEENS